jgi:hypothetical protein
MTEREWSQEEIDGDGEQPMICPVTQQPCLTEQDEFCDDYGCARQAGMDIDGKYNFADDFAKSIDFAYDHIRKRKANGGKGWRE